MNSKTIIWMMSTVVFLFLVLNTVPTAQAIAEGYTARDYKVGPYLLAFARRTTHRTGGGAGQTVPSQGSSSAHPREPQRFVALENGAPIARAHPTHQ